MNITIHPGKLAGVVRVPASKSVAHRALIAASLSDGKTVLRISALNADIEATMDALRALGAGIDFDAWSGLMTVRPIKRPRREVEIDCGESGSTLRFMLPVACALGASARFVGRGRLPERPNAALTDALRAHGAVIDADTLPMNVSGNIAGGLWTLPGNVSSQYVTGLLLALPLLNDDSEIRLTTPLQSAGYVDMTLQTLAQFGIIIHKTEAGWIVPGRQVYHSPNDLYVEGDWSAAAFWHAANALGSSVIVEGLSKQSAQGDRAVLDLLGKSEIDAANVPDLVPALAAAAAALPQRTVITGAARLRLKESDRLSAVADMLNALGGRAKVTDDGLFIDGGAVRGGEVDGRNDHRIVMAAAILATIAGAPVTISDSEAVAKSYPAFFDHFRMLGGQFDVQLSGR